MAILTCKICNTEFTRYGKQIINAKTCSFKCLGEYNKAKPNTVCEECGNNFHIKESQKKRYKRTHGYFCSTACVASFRKTKYLGTGNPNFREDVTKDQDGYLLTYIPKFGRIKLHHKVVFETLGIDKLPEGFCVHHRDCYIENNSPNNLALISNSDHRWVHKQFGSAGLWAYANGKISLEEIVSWSNDKERATRLLTASIVLEGEKNGFGSSN